MLGLSLVDWMEIEFPPEEAASAVGPSVVRAVRAAVLLDERLMLPEASRLAGGVREGRLMLTSALTRLGAGKGVPQGRLKLAGAIDWGVPEGDSWRDDVEPGWRDEEGEEREEVPLTGCGATGKVRRWPLARAWKNLRLSRMKRLQHAFWSLWGRTPEVCRYPQCLVPYLDTWRSSITSSCNSKETRRSKNKDCAW